MKINFDKVRNYNQLLLSIAGTGVLLFFLLGGIFVLWNELFRYRNVERYETGIIAETQTNKLLEDSIRKQIISFNQVGLIDSVEEVFILPVTQENLVKGESIDEVFGLINGFTGSGSFKSRSSKRYHSGTFNNIVLYNAKTRQSEIVFKSRISINNYLVEEYKDTLYLLITGTNKDSNKDDFLNAKDLQALFIYNVSTKQLSQINLSEKYSTLRLVTPSMSDAIFGKFGLDRNNDGKFNPRNEPIVIKQISFEDKSLIDVLEDAQIKLLQNLLEGR